MSPIQLRTDGAHILTLTSWLPKRCCHLSNRSVSLLPLCVLQIQALRDASPSPALHSQVARSPVYSVTPGPAMRHLCSCLSLITGLRPLGSCPCVDPSFVPTAVPSASSLVFRLGTVILCSHTLHDSLLPVIQAPACLPRLPPASPPAVVFPSLGEGHVNAVARPESPLHAAQPRVTAHVSAVTDVGS